MNEQNISPTLHETRPAHGGLGTVFDESEDDAGLVTVASGPYAEQLPLAHRTVADIRTRYHDRFDLDPNSQAMLDGQPVQDDVTVRPGQVLTFVHRAGEKGRGLP